MADGMRKYLLIGASAFVLGAGTMAFLGQTARATPEPRAETYHMLELFGNVLDTVERQYVTPVDDKKLIQAYCRRSRWAGSTVRSCRTGSTITASG